MRRLSVTIWLLALAGAAPAGAVTLEPIGSFEQPTFVTSDPSDPDRLFVSERLGRVQLLGEAGVSTVADLTSLVGCSSGACQGERGLMSITLAPDFPRSGHLYVFFADDATGTLHVDELTVSGDVAPLSTRRPLLAIPHAEASNHNGGQLQFGPEGNLFVSTGDGGGGNDQFHHAQRLDSLLGKLLRIDPRPSAARPYAVPAGNPFSTAPPPADTVWSYGLRNPFRFSFDRLTGDLTIGDVGQDMREEVDYAPRTLLGSGRGDNYGWNCREGLVAGPGDDLPPGQCAATAFVDPVFEYPHLDPGGGAAHGCAIIGGYVVRDPSLGDLYGRYLYTDLCSPELRSVQLPVSGGGVAGGDRSEGISASFPVSFGEDSCGRVYVVNGGGPIFRLEGDSPAVCPPPPAPPPPAPSAGQAATGATAPAPSALAASVRLTARDRVVEPGRRALLEAQVSPCPEWVGSAVTLNRGGRPLVTKRLDGDCAARFRPRILRRATFRALVPGDGARPSGRSSRVTVHLAARPGT